MGTDLLSRKPYYETDCLPNPFFRAFITRQEGVTSVPPHYHSELELILPYEVDGETLLSGKRVELSQDTLHYIAPDSVHAFRLVPQTEQSRVLVMKVNPSAVVQLLGEFPNAGKWNLQRLLACLPVMLSPVPQDVRTAFESLVTGVTPSASAALDAMSHLTRIFAWFLSVPAEEGKISKRDERVRRILDAMEALYTEEISLDDIAERASLSKFHLCRLFRAVTGQTVQDHLHELRLARAKELLAGGTNVTEAAYSSGFHNLSHFIQLFRKRTGKTPKQWALVEKVQG